ncbi:hypothetical protein ACLI1A_14050 [Flavobacterium sp. RHBU_3]|uniref:hypothetical protein n=1 Tax=Flavobacterium sp. RHBU_3 TaxID=3391184 RepID=UPI003984966D
MKLNHVLVAFVCAAFLVGCKQEKTETKHESAIIEEITNVRIVLEMVVKKEDNFQVFYSEIPGEGYTQEQSKIINVKGSDSPQKIVFNLSDELHPASFRLDFGDNKQQEPMEIKSFEFEYFGKKFTAKGTEFFKYFTVNESLVADTSKAILTPQTAKKDYDPQCYSTEPMLQAIHGMVPH